MPPRGATFDENTVPPLTRGDFRGVGAVTDNLVWLLILKPTPAFR